MVGENSVYKFTCALHISWQLGVQLVQDLGQPGNATEPIGGAAAMARLAARVLRMEQQADWLLACYGSCAAIRTLFVPRPRVPRSAE